MVYRLLLEYDGTDFSGWQTQAHGQRTVQGCLAKALEELCGEPVRVTGAGPVSYTHLTLPTICSV